MDLATIRLLISIIKASCNVFSSGQHSSNVYLLVEFCNVLDIDKFLFKLHMK